jgi:hypothetical protein
MALYSDKIVMGCTKKEGKLVCYAYDLSTLPLGADDPSMARRKCEITFDGVEPQFTFSGENGMKLCNDLLENLGEIIKKSSNLGIPTAQLQKIISKLSQTNSVGKTESSIGESQ